MPLKLGKSQFFRYGRSFPKRTSSGSNSNPTLVLFFSFKSLFKVPSSAFISSYSTLGSSMFLQEFDVLFATLENLCCSQSSVKPLNLILGVFVFFILLTHQKRL